MNYFLILPYRIKNNCKNVYNQTCRSPFCSACAPGWCASPGQDSPHQLDGALVGGPGRNDDYQDKRDDYIKNEVSVISNGVFQTAVAGKVITSR